MKNEIQLQCFIVSTPSFDTSRIRKLIREYDIKVWDAYSEPIKPGLNIIDEIQNRIKKSDFIIAVISDENPNVFYEIGLAQGFRKPIFLIIVGEKPRIPLSYFSYLKYKPDDVESFKFSFEPFIESLFSKKKDRKRRQKKVEFIDYKELSRENLISALKDEDSNLRKAAVEALGKLGTHDDLPKIEQMLKDEASDVRQAAVEALSKLGTHDDLPKIEQMLKDASWSVRVSAVKVLGDTRDKRAIKPLIWALKDNNSDVRKIAAKALGEIGNEKAVEPLILALKDENWGVRKTIINELKRFNISLDKKYLFSLKLDYKQYLKDGLADNKLKEAFENNKQLISSDSKISKIDEKHWEIIDGTKSYKIENTGTHLNIYYRNYLEELERLRQTGYERDAEKLLKDVFNYIGIMYKESPKIERGFRPDFSVWLDSLEGVFGNPLIVELKLGNLSEQQLSSAERQLYSYLSKTNAKAGILLYLDRRGKRFPGRGFVQPNIIRIDLSDLIRELDELTLEEILIRERNKMVHIREV